MLSRDILGRSRSVSEPDTSGRTSFSNAEVAEIVRFRPSRSICSCSSATAAPVVLVSVPLTLNVDLVLLSDGLSGDACTAIGVIAVVGLPDAIIEGKIELARTVAFDMEDVFGRRFIRAESRFASIDSEGRVGRLGATASVVARLGPVPWARLSVAAASGESISKAELSE